MSLSLSFDIGRSALATTADRSAVVTRNVARADDPGATRKSMAILTSFGGVKSGDVVRVANDALFDSHMKASSAASALSALSDGIDAISQAFGDSDLEQGPAALVAKLAGSLQELTAAPHDMTRAFAVLTSAKDLALGLNDLAGAVVEVRERADYDISIGVARLETLLGDFHDLNQKIMVGTQLGEDVTDEMDRRDGVLQMIAEDVDVRAITRSNNDMVLFAADGITLFETTPRAVEFARSNALPAGADGGMVLIDGVPISHGGATGDQNGGRLAGLLRLRDEVAPTLLRQLDEVARNLIVAFAETDQSAVPSLPDLPGLFTFAGATGVPTAGLVDGLASRIEVNANADPARGGDPGRLRDGGISNPADPAYTYNVGGGVGFTDRIVELVSRVDAAWAFDPAAGLSNTGTIGGYAADVEGWFQDLRTNVLQENEYQSVVAGRAFEVLSGRVGINIDEEMTELLELERSYQASSRLLQTVDSMFEALFDATR